jgi:hypothetical protein
VGISPNEGSTKAVAERMAKRRKAMRQFGAAFALVLCALPLDRGRALAEAGAPAPPAFETELFSGAELLAGKSMTEAQCATLPGAAWVVVDRRGACVRYYHSTAGGSGREALISLTVDVVSTNERGEARPLEFYLKESPALIEKASANWSRRFGLPYVLLGRPGTYGSSGEHAKRRTAHEVAVVSAGLDAIKARHGYTRLHLVGHGTAGHTAAALLPHRSDLGCVVLASALVSVKNYLAESGRNEDVTGNKKPLDPSTLVDLIVKRADLRILVLTDPDDVVISARSQTAYVKRLAAAGLPVRQIFVAASGPSAHNLYREANQVAAACAKGMDHERIVATYQNKVPEVAPDAPDPPLHSPAALARSATINESQCKALATMALWVGVDGRGFCVRYWISTAGGKKDEATVYFGGDLGPYVNNRLELNRFSASVTAGGVQRSAHRWSRMLGGPYVVVGRLGTYGSSGDHRERRSWLEVRVATAALDGLKERYGFKRLHPVGQSGGAHTVAALAQMRSDIGCAVMASGALSVKSVRRDRGLPVTSKVKASYDPIDHVGTMQHHAGRRMIVMSDPDDAKASFRSQKEFVDRLKAKELPILHVTAAAGDRDFHGLASEGHRLAGDCAKGVDDDTLVARYQTKTAPVARRK